MKQNLCQTTDDGSNVIVQTTNSNNRHYYSGNFEVDNLEKVDDQTIIDLFLEASKEDILKKAKLWLRTQTGFATSNVCDEKIGITYNDIVKYKKS